MRNFIRTSHEQKRRSSTFLSDSPQIERRRRPSLPFLVGNEQDQQHVVDRYFRRQSYPATDGQNIRTPNHTRKGLQHSTVIDTFRVQAFVNIFLLIIILILLTLIWIR